MRERKNTRKVSEQIFKNKLEEISRKLKNTYKKEKKYLKNKKKEKRKKWSDIQKERIKEETKDEMGEKIILRGRKQIGKSKQYLLLCIAILKENFRLFEKRTLSGLSRSYSDNTDTIKNNKYQTTTTTTTTTPKK